MKWTTGLLLLAIFVFPAAGLMASSPDVCIDYADSLIEAWQHQGLSKEAIDQLHQRALLECLDGGEDRGLACMSAAGNIELALLARQVVAKHLTVAEYIALNRDRSRKLALARANPAWGDACPEGDKDGDLVPDPLDRCPETKPFTVTDDVGCATDVRPPEGPSDSEVHNYLERMGLLSDPACDGAVAPGAPLPKGISFFGADQKLYISLNPPNNQPADCELLYEVRARLEDPVNPNLPPVAYYHLILSAQDLYPSTDGLFGLDPADSGQRLKLFQNWADYGKASWRVRAVNGNGLTSTWLDFSQPVQIFP